MIVVQAKLDKKGCIDTLSSNGHADNAPLGENIPCAAVTALVRTAARLLFEAPELGISGEASRAGELGFRLQNVPRGQRGYVRGISDFLLRGIGDIATEFPQQVNLLLN